MSSEYLLNQAVEAYNSGNKQSARWLLTDLLNDDPYNEEGWLWLALVVDTDEERLQCLEQVLAINPYNEDARRELAMLLPDEVDWYQTPSTPTYPEPSQESSVPDQLCSNCSQPIDTDDKFCRFCGQPLAKEATPSDSETRDPQYFSPKPWYFSTPVLIFTFLFLTPLWSILVLADDQQSGIAKLFALLIVLIYILLLFFGSLYYGALTAG